jgi:hypothetical protein
MHIIELVINQNASGPYFNKYLADNYAEYAGISYNDTAAYITFSSDQHQTTHDIIETYYNSLTENDVLPETTLSDIYGFITQEGFKWNTTFRINLINEFYSATISMEDALYIEGKISVVIELLYIGDWASAIIELADNVVVSETVSQDDTDNEYTQVRHDGYIAELQLFIDTYY